MGWLLKQHSLNLIEKIKTCSDVLNRVSCDTGLVEWCDSLHGWPRLFKQWFYGRTWQRLTQLLSKASNILGASTLLDAANGPAIHTYGDKLMKLSLNGRKFVWKFKATARCDVMQPLFIADFLCSNTLTVDVKGQRPMDPTTYTSLPLLVTNTSAHGIHNVAYHNDLSAFLTELLDIHTPSFSNPTVKHKVVHYIPTEGPQIHSAGWASIAVSESWQCII